MRIRINKKDDELIEKLKHLYSFKYEGIIPRIAFAYSIQLDKKFDLEKAVLLNADGRDFRDDRGLFGVSVGNRPNYIVYKTILEQHYNKNLFEGEFSKLFRLHLSFGLEKIYNDIQDKSIASGYHVNYLMNIVKNGLALLSKKQTISYKTAKNITVKEYKNLIEFELGTNENDEVFTIRLNDLKEFDSNHIAIAGMTGSGKTQLIKDILYQITKKTGNQLNFIFFDYKGEKKEKLVHFLEHTNCNFIDILKDSYEFNPLSIINSENENERNNQIQNFVDILSGIETSLGTRQQQMLKKVIRNYIDENSDKIPTIEDIYENLQIYYEENKIKVDTLIDIFDKLSNGLFSKPETNSTPIYQQNIYLNLPNSIPETVRQLSVFFTLKYLLNIFSNTDDTQPDNNRINPVRYIIVIDEAHVYLKNKRARKALEELLRVVRSKGVVVIMLSQGAEDYKQKDFDFSSQVKIPICLNVKNKDYRIIEPFLGTPSSKFKLEQAIGKIQNGYGVINIKEPNVLQVRQLWKTMKEENIG